jgi:hypothetical protein
MKNVCSSKNLTRKVCKMKGKLFFLVLVVVLVFGLTGCSAQSSSKASSSNEKKLLGAWTVVFTDDSEMDGTIWTFNQDGTINIKNTNGQEVTVEYYVTPSIICIKEFESSRLNDFYISTDGLTFIIDGYSDNYIFRKNN